MNRVLLRRIVCAVDLSGRSVSSLKRAMQLAHVHGGELFVVHVTNVRLAITESAQRTVSDAFSALRRLTNAEPHQTAPVRWIMAHGDPAIELARFIRRTDADLAVVGGASPRPSTGIVGTVADAILRTTACPVLVIPPTPDDDTSPTPYREILCGVSSGFSTLTLRYALSFAQESESRLTILTVDDRNRAHRASDDRIGSDIDRLRAEIPDSARDWSVIDELVATGEPAEELVKTAHRIDTDLVVVGSTRTSGADVGLGSVALGALTLTVASVLIVPTPPLAREMDATLTV
jgi:nucleotide-binding universal stress UspA family protein